MIEQQFDKVVSGMGSIPHSSGVAFRVWAPNAEAVFVTGSFNNWSNDSHPMSSENNGYWYVNVPEAAVGNEYRFRLVHGDIRPKASFELAHIPRYFCLKIRLKRSHALSRRNALELAP